MAKAPAIGIDLGTSNSCVAAVVNGNVKVIWNDAGNRITPSCVAFNANERLVGEKAKAHAIFDPANTIFEAKRVIGRQFEDPGVQKRLNQWPIINVHGNPKFKVQFKGSNKEVTPEEISALILIEMKAMSERVLNSKVTDAVITVPAYFNDSQRQATLDAGKIAGLNVLKLLNEPTAAALAYGFDQKLKCRKNILVYDFGGGTLDVAILSISGSEFEVLATDGDTFLGGSDLDQCLVTHFVDRIKSKYEADISGNPRALYKLKIACETAKKNLSSPDSDSSNVIVASMFSGDKDFKQSLSRAKLNMLCADHFAAAMRPVDSVLKQAKMNADDIDEVVLAGGSTRIPKIKELLMKKLRKNLLNETIDPDQAVAYGAALHASVLAGDRSVEEIKLLEVTSHSYGIHILGNLMSKIIRRNTKIPVKQTRRFVTTVDYQSGVDLKVYQGERLKSDENRLLGELSLENIRPALKGIPQIVVTFSIDENCILTVSAVDESTGNSEQLVIRLDKGRLSEGEIERMVTEAEEYADEKNRRKLRESARYEVETLCYELKQVLVDLDTHDDSDEIDLREYIQVCNETQDWLDENEVAPEDEYHSLLDVLKEMKERLEN